MRCAATPSSTVCKSSTLKESYANVRLGANESGKVESQVLSPKKAICLPAALTCDMMESSTTADPPKLLPTSTKVGRLPVVSPLILWIVVVGGSAWAWNMKLLCGYFVVSWYGRVSAL